MTVFFAKHRRKIAMMLLINFLVNFLAPLKSLAITSGPSQPEMQGFQPIGSSDMVDLFSGDFKYNIPLMDVGGYPLNLGYSAGTGIDDEASWVGTGWSLTPGVINRQMKALPDDFKGDEVTKEVNLKKKIKIGVAAEFKPDVFAFEISKNKIKRTLDEYGDPKGSPVGFKSSLYKDNYYGWSAGLGINASLDLTSSAGGSLTTDLGINSSSRDGAGISPSINLAYADAKNDKQDKLGLNLGFDYNSRQGLQQLSLGASYNRGASHTLFEKLAGVSYVDNGVTTYTPTIDLPRKNESYTLSFHFGVELFGFKGVMGIDGSYSEESIKTPIRNVPAYGYLYANEVTSERESESLVDVNREKDVPYFKGTPVIPVPVLTNDNFLMSSQNGSGQFKISRKGSGIGHDPYVRTTGSSNTLGIDFASGNLLEGGGHFYRNDVINTTNKWNGNGSSYQAIGDYKGPNANPLIQHAIFKKSGEMTQSDEDYLSSLGKEKAVGISVAAGSAFSSPTAKQVLYDNNNNNYPLNSTSLETNRRQKRVDNLTYLTAQEASRYGLDKFIYSYNPISPSTSFDCSLNNSRTAIPRVSSDRKPHHISEITVLDNQGKRMVYGIPVYNIKQEEVTFSIKPASDGSSERQSGLVGYEHGVDNTATLNIKGRDHYFSKDVIPPYATSFLLTAIVSPDYRDLKNDGITDDDFGNAVKFNYTKLDNLYKWRTPYGTSVPNVPSIAGYNEGLRADKEDDKGNYTYGEKEIWYMHSIESKNFVAVFYTSPLTNNGYTDGLEHRRLDGLGVADDKGGQGSFLLKRLDSIALFSKPEFKHSGSHAIPIKVVHFEYDYSTGKNFPNCINTNTALGTGKLTLLRVFFTYGRNQKGNTTPYQFSYKQAYTANGTKIINPDYGLQQTDKWGTYKPASFNPIIDNNPNTHLTNSEFPYALQDAAIGGELAGLWNLEIIALPSGGEIKIDYEADDYAFVQNKRACNMFTLAGISDGDHYPNSFGGDNFINANFIYVRSKQDYGERANELIKGLKYLYGKFYVTLRPGVYDYLPGYAEIVENQNITKYTDPDGSFVYGIQIKKINTEGLSGEVNPFAVASWQFLRNNLPQYAYPGFDNGTAGVDNIGTNIVGAIKALGQSIFNFAELFENYNKKYYRLGYANDINLSRSWVRLTEPTGKKIGGGHRVKKVTIKDNWGSMAGGNYADNEYGQLYDYTTKDENNNTVSSGVASYEPGVGSDENPFKTPIPYSRKVKMGLDYNTYVEEPVGESYMPSPTVGYRKVTVKSFGASNSIPNTNSENKIGFTENEFYTAKEFPTIIEKIGPAALSYDPKLILTLVASVSRSNMVTTQGLSVIQNDMHGKPKAVKTYDKNKNLLSSVEYTYKVKDPAAEVQVLNNEVDLLKSNGKVEKGKIGQDIEFYSDMRYQQTVNTGLRLGVYLGSTSFVFFTLPFGFKNIGANAALVSFNSASTIKLITKYGIVQSVTKMENGSTATTENLMWDPETGDVLLTKTNNEFDQPVYNLTYPAHWVNSGMGAAYQNLESVLPNVSTDLNGELTSVNSTNITSLLHEGDELIDLTGNANYWVINGENYASDGTKYLIDKAGKRVLNLDARTLKVHYSGYRNLSSTGVATIVSLNNPVSNGKIKVDTYTKVLDAKAVVYSDLWGMPISNTLELDEEVSNSCITCDYGNDCFKNFLYAAMGAKLGTSGKPAIFSTLSDNQNAGSIMEKAAVSPYSYISASPSSTCFNSFYGNTTAYQNNYYKANLNGNVAYNPTLHKYVFTLNANDVAYLGGRKVTFTSVSSAFNNLINLSTGTTGIWQELFNNARYGIKRTNVEGGCKYELFYDDSNPEARSVGDAGTASAPNPCSLIPNGQPILELIMEYGKQYSSHCADPLHNVINPYFYGIKGTWKPLQSYVYQVNRVNSVPAQSTSISNIRNTGYYASFNPFIGFSQGNATYSTADSRWVWSQKSRYYTTKGEEVESEDALHRFTAALYGYKETLPIAVGKNTRHLEMYYDGFEDYYNQSSNGSIGSNCIEPCSFLLSDKFSIKNNISSTIKTVSTIAHSGKYSLEVSTPLTLTTNTSDYSTIDDAILTRSSNEYILNNNYLAKGFTPKQDKKYILSFWIKDNDRLNFAPKVSVNINGTDHPAITSTKWPIVEGWKRVELEFNAGTASTLNIVITPSGTVNIDDLRVFAADAQIKTYAYDPITQRLMAELDENNFATFYEYDDEGTLQRVKKETERGIMTIKESRQHIRKTYNHP